MRILVGGPTRSVQAPIWKAHRDCLLGQRLSSEYTLDIDHQECPDTGGPKWDGRKMEQVGRVRQGFIDRVSSGGEHDALFMVDDDLLLGDWVLQRMLDTDADVVYGVFLSNWGNNLTRKPQVWDVSPYGQTPELEAKLAEGMSILGSDFGFDMLMGEPREVEVFGGGACTLIRGKGLESRYAPLLESLRRRKGADMWGGEDRTFCLGLEARGVKQIAVTGLPILHLDTPEKQTPPAIEEAGMMLEAGWSYVDPHGWRGEREND